MTTEVTEKPQLSLMTLKDNVFKNRKPAFCMPSCRILLEFPLQDKVRIKVPIGFEPMKDGFADRSLRPLGYSTIDGCAL